MDKMNILIVEDQKLMRVGLKSLLEEFDFINVISEASTGKEALEEIYRQPINVVLMDIGLIDGSGVDFAKKIKALHPEIRIIILTSYVEKQKILDSLSIGVNAYVIKDIGTDILAMIIKTVNDGAIWLDPQVVDIIKDKSPSLLLQENVSNAKFKEKHANLTQREYEVLKLIVDGKSNHQIAEELIISEHTAKAHVCNIIQKLVVDDRTQAAVKALKEGLV